MPARRLKGAIGYWPNCATPRKNLWDAWELSKKDKETSTKEKVVLPGHARKGGKSANERNKASIKSEGWLPNSSYMGELNKIWEKECKILGMNEGQVHRDRAGGAPSSSKLPSHLKPLFHLFHRLLLG
jgi:hypothetical protein